MSDPIPKITVYKDDKMPMAHPRPIRTAKTAQIRRICRFEYGDDLSMDDQRPEPEPAEVAWGYLSREYQASLIAQQEGAYMREDSGVAGFKVSRNPYNSGAYGVNGPLQPPYGQQYQQYQQQYPGQPQYQHPAYAQATGPPASVMPSAKTSWTEKAWRSITGTRGHTQGPQNQVKDESWYC